MKRTLASSLLFFLSFFISVCPGYGKDQVPLGLDGEVWLSLNEAGGLGPESDPHIANLCKMGIVRGVYDGLLFGKSPLMGAYYTNTSLPQLVEAVDRFYSDPANRKIPAAVALWVVSRELTGASGEAIEEPLKDLRRHFSK